MQARRLLSQSDASFSPRAVLGAPVLLLRQHLRLYARQRVLRESVGMLCGARHRVDMCGKSQFSDKPIAVGPSTSARSVVTGKRLSVLFLALVSFGRVAWADNPPVKQGMPCVDPERPHDSHHVVGRHRGSVTGLAVTANGRVLSGGEDGVVGLWDPRLRDDAGRVLARHDEGISAIAVAEESRQLAIGTVSGGLSLFELSA